MSSSFLEERIRTTVTIDAMNGLHVILTQVEVEDGEIFQDSSFIRGFTDDSNATLILQ